jgi:cell division protein FtsL
MGYYYRGNLAVDIENSRSVIKKKRTVKIRPTIPTGEKLLYLFMITLVVAGAVIVGLRYVQMSEYNYQIQNLKQEIRKNQEKNAALQLQIDRMSNRDRIYSEAATMMMTTTKSDSIKVVGSQQPAAKTDSSQTD